MKPVFKGWNCFRAWLGGYFWLPCPLCGEMFGGHQWRKCGSIRTKQPGLNKLVCPRCSKRIEA